MSDARAEALLRSALEKIVYFEARSGQLEGDAAAARAELDRLRADLGAASAREVELRQQLAEYEVNLARAHRDREELGRVVDALRLERATLVEKLLDAARIRGALSQDDGSFDLAAFISQLRSEVLAARGVAPPAPAPEAVPEVGEREPWEPTVEEAPLDDAAAFQAEVARQMASGVWEGGTDPEAGATGGWAPRAPHQASAPDPRSPSAAELAEGMRAEGRLGSPRNGSPRRRGRADETLFGFSVRELSAPEPAARIRAAERLGALGDPAASSALAAALHAERDPRASVAFLEAFRSLAGPEGAAVVVPFLDAPSAEVRIAALRALVALDPHRAVPQLDRAARDVSPSVRRRAALLALQLPPEQAAALEHGRTAEADPEVRRVTALAAGASAGGDARPALLAALDDPALKVRQAAARSLSRLLGVEVAGIATLDGPHRRREIRRLSTLPLPPLSTRAQSAAARAGPPARAAGARRSTVAVVDTARSLPPARTGESAERLCGAVLGELRSAMRGCSMRELVEVLGAPDDAVEAACVLLTARGQVVRRGTRLFVA